MSNPDYPLPENAIAALKRGDRIEAVKLTRSLHGLDLSAAKLAVDVYLGAHPDTMRRASSERGRGGGLIALLLLGAAVAAAYLLWAGIF